MNKVHFKLFALFRTTCANLIIAFFPSKWFTWLSSCFWFNQNSAVYQARVQMQVHCVCCKSWTWGERGGGDRSLKLHLSCMLLGKNVLYDIVFVLCENNITISMFTFHCLLSKRIVILTLNQIWCTQLPDRLLEHITAETSPTSRIVDSTFLLIKPIVYI